MYCEECKKNPASVHLIQVINGKKVETHLCEECAAKKGAILFNVNNKFSIPNLLGSIFVNPYSVQDFAGFTKGAKCPNCGMSFNDIRQTGKLGCSECYKIFENELEPTLRRMQGNSQHVGKIPSRSGEKVLMRKQIENLKTGLQEAVAHEKYEEAAEIRDRIKDIERKLG